MSRASPRSASRIVLVSGLAFGAFADDAVDALRNAIGAADAKAESVQKALQPVVDSAATAGLPPLSEGIDNYEEKFESGAAEAARRADRGDAE